MNELLKKLMLESGYAAPELAGRAIVLSDAIVQECIDNLYLNGYDDAATQLSKLFKDKNGLQT